MPIKKKIAKKKPVKKTVAKKPKYRVGKKVMDMVISSVSKDGSRYVYRLSQYGKYQMTLTESDVTKALK